ncbi:MAG TPA: HAD-IB family hydrolase [Acidimicrobiales bacterium]|nr:HAD-IB family hydrolase [Acidimicrobiales bacterium]
MAGDARGVAAFDFDGTLVPRDSFVGFLRLIGGTRTVNAAFARSWRAVAVRPTPGWRDAIKSELVRSVLAGREAAEVEAGANEYAKEVAGMVSKPMRVLLSRHREAGHATVIVSASLEIYLDPAASILGIDDVLGTRLEAGPDGRLTGRLLGANCRGVEKARRLSEWMAGRQVTPDLVPVWAYGDSAGDREMLELARFATKVRRARPRAITPSLG